MNHRSIVRLLLELGNLMDYAVALEEGNIDVIYRKEAELYTFQIEDTNHNKNILENYNKAKKLNPTKHIHIFFRKSPLIKVFREDPDCKVIYLQKSSTIPRIEDYKLKNISKIEDLDLLDIEPAQKQEIIRLYNFIKKRGNFSSKQELVKSYDKSGMTTHKYLAWLIKLKLVKMERDKDNWTAKISLNSP